MDFAFPALVILILSLPGIFFVLGFKNGSELLGSLKEGFGDFGDISKAVALGSLISLTIHLLWIGVILSALHFFPACPFIRPANINVVVNLIAAPEETSNHNEPKKQPAEQEPHQVALNNLAEFFPQISLYVLSSSFSGVLLGLTAKRLTRFFSFDVRYKILRMDNPWDYFLNGHDYVLDDVTEEFGRPKWWSIFKTLRKYEMDCYASLLVHTTGKGVIINGVVEDWEFDALGGLQTLILRETTRMNIPTTSIDPLTFYGTEAEEIAENNPLLNYTAIKGDRFIVPFKTVKNMNTLFVYVDKADKLEPTDLATTSPVPNKNVIN